MRSYLTLAETSGFVRILQIRDRKDKFLSIDVDLSFARFILLFFRFRRFSFFPPVTRRTATRHGNRIFSGTPFFRSSRPRHRGCPGAHASYVPGGGRRVSRRGSRARVALCAQARLGGAGAQLSRDAPARLSPRLRSATCSFFCSGVRAPWGRCLRMRVFR